MDRFGRAFSDADEVTLLPVYSASEQPIEGATAQAMLRAIRAGGRSSPRAGRDSQVRLPAPARPAVAIRSPEETLRYFQKTAQAGDMILFLGAGSVGGLAPRLLKQL